MEGRRPLEGGWQPDSDPRGKETLAAPLSLSRGYGSWEEEGSAGKFGFLSSRAGKK